MQQDISSLRLDYKKSTLDETDVDQNPIQQFNVWFDEILKANIDEPNAMTLATIDAQNKPHARIVLLKGVTSKGFVFYTNYESLKAENMAANPQVALVFFWKEIERQVRIEGIVEKISEEESIAYFKSRPIGSQLGAIASQQSAVIESRTALEQQYEQVKNKYENQEITKPANWGGYIVKPSNMEFWQGRSSRLHDRLKYTLDEKNSWIVSRLQP
jgi:pyridoxamine 5'-phosphate oxidase